jgi:glycogen debranching enzyme
MLPNRFPDHGEAPEFNSVDASLWYVVAVHELLTLPGRDSEILSTSQRAALESAVDAIVTGYAAGTRFDLIHIARLSVSGMVARRAASSRSARSRRREAALANAEG